MKFIKININNYVLFFFQSKILLIFVHTKPILKTSNHADNKNHNIHIMYSNSILLNN